MILFNKLLHGKKYLIFAVYAVIKNTSDQKNGIWVFACSVNIAFTYFFLKSDWRTTSFGNIFSPYIECYSWDCQPVLGSPTSWLIHSLPLSPARGTEVLKAAAVNTDTVWPDEAALEGKARRQARTSLKSGSEKQQWRRRMFVWAVSSKESSCKKPQLKQGAPEIREVAHFWKVCGFRRSFLACVSTKLTFMRTRLFLCFLGVFFFKKSKRCFLCVEVSHERASLSERTVGLKFNQLEM